MLTKRKKRKWTMNSQIKLYIGITRPTFLLPNYNKEVTAPESLGPLSLETGFTWPTTKPRYPHSTLVLHQRLRSQGCTRVWTGVRCQNKSCSAGFQVYFGNFIVTNLELRSGRCLTDWLSSLPPLSISLLPGWVVNLTLWFDSFLSISMININ